MHISKNYILFPIKSTPTTHNSKKITSQNKYNNISRKYIPILLNYDNSSLWTDAYPMYTVIGWQWLEAILIGQWPTKRGFPHSPYLLRWRSG